MTKCSCFRLSPDTKYVLEQIRAEFGFKSVSAVIRELCWYISHGKNYPGSDVDIEDFLSKVRSGDFIGRESINDKMKYREIEITKEHISVLEQEYGDAILRLMMESGVKKALEWNKGRWILNIQHTIMEKCDVGLLDFEVVNLCQYWYNEAKRNGTVSKLQKEVISNKWGKLTPMDEEA